MADRRTRRARQAAHLAAGGTVTQTTSTRFGDLHGPRTTVALELARLVDGAHSRTSARTCWPSSTCSAPRPACHPRGSTSSTARTQWPRACVARCARSACGAAGIRRQPRGSKVRYQDAAAARAGHARAFRMIDLASAPSLVDMADPTEGTERRDKRAQTPTFRCCASLATARPIRSPQPVARRRSRGTSRRHGPGRRRRRAGIRLPLQPTRLPRPASPRGRRHRARSTRSSMADLQRDRGRIGDAEWILHAANQDLPCLAEVGPAPAAAVRHRTRRPAARRRAGGAGHDGRAPSRRPAGEGPFRGGLEHPAAPPRLAGVRGPRRRTADCAARRARRRARPRRARPSGRSQEFEAVRTAPPTPPREDPWRRTSGIHAVRSRRQLAAVRALWYARDELAAARDIAPGRILPDSAIIAAVRADPSRPADLVTLPVFSGPRQRRETRSLVRRARSPPATLPDDQLPPITGGARPGAACRHAGETAPRMPLTGWLAAARSSRRWPNSTSCSARICSRQTSCAASRGNRRSRPIGARSAPRCARLGARPWQVELTAAALAGALA